MKKILRKSIYVFILIIFAACYEAAENEAAPLCANCATEITSLVTENNESPLIGKWLTHHFGSPIEIDIYPNGTFLLTENYEGDHEQYNGIWHIHDGLLFLLIQDDYDAYDVLDVFTFNISGNFLTLKDKSDEITFERIGSPTENQEFFENRERNRISRPNIEAAFNDADDLAGSLNYYNSFVIENQITTIPEIHAILEGARFNIIIPEQDDRDEIDLSFQLNSPERALEIIGYLFYDTRWRVNVEAIHAAY
jgi:hypothetical protein